jgi:hypothetical protein
MFFRSWDLRPSLSLAARQPRGAAGKPQHNAERLPQHPSSIIDVSSASINSHLASSHLASTVWRFLRMFCIVCILQTKHLGEDFHLPPKQFASCGSGGNRNMMFAHSMRIATKIRVLRSLFSVVWRILRPCILQFLPIVPNCLALLARLLLYHRKGRPTSCLAPGDPKLPQKIASCANCSWVYIKSSRLALIDKFPIGWVGGRHKDFK